jgi:S-layer glycoprotein
MEITNMTKRLLFALVALTILASACSGDDADTTTQPVDSGAADDAPADDAPASDDMADDEMATGPAAVSADDQTGGGTTITVASVTLPSAGFVVIHADNGGAPGPVIGHSALLSAGESTDVVVSLDTALDADTTVFPMAHVDANDNGEYEFAPPDVTTDVPATTADGPVAVTAIGYTLDEMADDAASSVGADNQTGDGTTVTIASVTLAADGFVAIHADNGGAPGPVIGVSDLLLAGDSSDVVVTLDAPLDADAKVFPMAHIDVNENGEYDFAPPDVTTDSPATTTDGAVAVVGIDYTLG